MPENVYIETLPNGLTLLGERMENVSSAAINLVTPAGASRDADKSQGAAAIACDWLFRGAGQRDTRQLLDALDSLGIQHGQAVQSEHLHFSATQIGKNLPQALEIFADVLRRPRLEDATFEPCRDLVLQDLASIEDEPEHKCSVMVREQFYPRPLGRCVHGQAETLAQLTPDKVRRHIELHVGPRGSLLAVAGNIDWPACRDLMVRLLGDWAAQKSPAPSIHRASCGITHVQKDTAQEHIALAHASVPMTDRRYYAARLAETILSGGMSSRLCTEVREKRGLAYQVGSHYDCLRRHAGMFTYAGTRADQAQQTLELVVGEIRRLGEAIAGDELSRAKIQLKSRVVMQGESTGARAGSLASDWYHLRRVRSLAEVCSAIDSVTVDDVVRYLREVPPARFTVVTIGPRTLDTAVVKEA